MPAVISCLADIAISVDAVICVESETYDKFETKVEEKEEGEKPTEEVIVASIQNDHVMMLNMIVKNTANMSFWYMKGVANCKF